MARNIDKSSVPAVTIPRLALCLRKLRELKARGVERVSSKDLAQMIDLNAAQIRKDFSYFGEFGTRGVGYEVPRLVDEITRPGASDRAGVLRAVHTLKGITALLEVESIATFCHDLEQRLIESDSLPTSADRAEATALWTAVRALHEQLGGTSAKSALEIADADYARLLHDLERGCDSRAVARFVRSWREERASVRIGRLASQLPLFARRVGKSNIEISVTVTPPELRVPPDCI